MAQALPPRPNLEWLRKTAKKKLGDLQSRQPGSKLADAQLALAREYGFSSWRALKSHVDAQLRAPVAESPPRDEATVAAFLRAVVTATCRPSAQRWAPRLTS